MRTKSFSGSHPCPLPRVSWFEQLPLLKSASSRMSCFSLRAFETSAVVRLRRCAIKWTSPEWLSYAPHYCAIGHSVVEENFNSRNGAGIGVYSPPQCLIQLFFRYWHFPIHEQLNNFVPVQFLSKMQVILWVVSETTTAFCSESSRKSMKRVKFSTAIEICI